jgi:hypothetical protein
VKEIIRERARALLEQAFQWGVAKGGDRRSCFQMEEELANKLPAEEWVSRYAIQSWLSSRLTQEKNEKNPKYVRDRAVEATKQKLFDAAWGFNPLSLNMDSIKERLSLVHKCTPSTRRKKGDYRSSLKKKGLLEFLYSKEKVPDSFADMASFLAGLTLGTLNLNPNLNPKP